MLDWLRTYIREEASLPEEDLVVVWAALVAAFFFLLRASEYLCQDGRSWSAERILRGEDIEPRRDGKRVLNFAEADELVLYIKGSKTDQLNVGTARNRYKAGATLCPLSAPEALQAHRPQRLRGSEERMPLFRWASGLPIKRAEIQHFLTVAGLAAGLSRKEWAAAP